MPEMRNAALEGTAFRDLIQRNWAIYLGHLPPPLRTLLFTLSPVLLAMVLLLLLLRVTAPASPLKRRSVTRTSQKCDVSSDI